MTPKVKDGSVGCPSHFGLEGFLTMSAVQAESSACAPVRGGPEGLPVDKNTS